MNLPKILKYARKMSQQSDHHSHRIGCVITDSKGRIYSGSPNFLTKTHPVYNKIAPLKTLHAEAAAILSIRHKTDFSKLQLFVYREFADGTPALSKPCPHCMELIRNYGITTIWYTTPDGLMKESVYG